MKYEKGGEILSADRRADQRGGCGGARGGRGHSGVGRRRGRDDRRKQARGHIWILPGRQEEFLEKVAATGKPVVLVLFSGRPLTLTWAFAHVPARDGGVVSRRAGGSGVGAHDLR